MSQSKRSVSFECLNELAFRFRIRFKQAKYRAVLTLIPSDSLYSGGDLSTSLQPQHSKLCIWGAVVSSSPDLTVGIMAEVILLYVFRRTSK